MLTELDQNTGGIPWMHKKDLFVACAAYWMRPRRRIAGLPNVLHCDLNIRHIEG